MCSLSALHPYDQRPPAPASSPVRFMSAEGEGEVGRYFLKVLLGDVAILVLIVVLHYGLQGATQPIRWTISALQEEQLVLLYPAQ